MKPIERNHQHVGKAKEINFLGEMPGNFALRASPLTRRRHGRREKIIPNARSSSSRSSPTPTEMIGTDNLSTKISPKTFLDSQKRVRSVGNRKGEALKLLVSKAHCAAGQTLNLKGNEGE